MSRIVMVHGAGNDLWGPASIKARWFPALADGLAWHGVAVDEQDVTVAFYGDVFRPDPQEGYRPPVDKAGAVASIAPHFHTLADTKAGGSILWVVGELFSLVALGIVLYQWMQLEERQAIRADRRSDAEAAMATAPTHNGAAHNGAAHNGSTGTASDH